MISSLPWWSFVMKFLSCSSCTIFWNVNENLSKNVRNFDVYCGHLTPGQYPSCQHPQHPREPCISVNPIILSLEHTPMIIISLDWNRVGFAAGSSIVDEDWNDWNSPATSWDRAKLFLNRTWTYDQSFHSETEQFGWCTHNIGDCSIK